MTSLFWCDKVAVLVVTRLAIQQGRGREFPQTYAAAYYGTGELKTCVRLQAFLGGAGNEGLPHLPINNNHNMILIIALALVACLSFAAYALAKGRNRTGWKWALLIGFFSFLFLPLGILLFLGAAVLMKTRDPETGYFR